MLNPDGRFSSIVVWALIILPILVFRRAAREGTILIGDRILVQRF